MNLMKLAAKFESRDIEWRVQQSGKGKNNIWALVIPYITNRAIMQRLDDVIGAGVWQNKFISSPCGQGYQCGISIKIGDEWITRWDGAETASNGGIDPVKSTMSNSMKRAGVQWGIGRYLYRLDAQFTNAEYCDNRKDCPEGWIYQQVKAKNNEPNYGMAWKIPELPLWALPTSNETIKAHFNDVVNAHTLSELKKAYKYAYNIAENEQDDELMQRFIKAKDEAKDRIQEQEATKQEQESVEAVAFIKEQIELFKTLTNESVLNGQFKMSLASAGKIRDPEMQNKAIKALNKAKAEMLIQLNKQG
jgi:hypothetical protein